MSSVVVADKLIESIEELGYHRPRKDQCDICISNRNKPSNLQNDNEFKAHIDRKEEAKNSMQYDDERSKTDPTFLSASIDLQKVLSFPSAEASVLYYKRKLNLYNFKLYLSSKNDAKGNEAYCFVWSEGDGKRGTDEIGTCLSKWAANLHEHIQHVTLYSDCRGGQNSNIHIAFLLLYITQRTHIKSISINYLESGRTQMARDSIHSSIESEKKGGDVYSRMQWIHIIKNARRKNPYSVINLSSKDFLSVKELCEIITNRKFDTQGRVVNWMKIKTLKACENDPSTLYYGYRYYEEFE